MLYVYCSTLPSLLNFASCLYYQRDAVRYQHERNVVQHYCVVLQFGSQKEQFMKIKAQRPWQEAIREKIKGRRR